MTKQHQPAKRLVNSTRHSGIVTVYPMDVSFEPLCNTRNAAMDRNTLFEHVNNLFSTEPDYPWQKYPNCAVLRHSGNNKWFGLVMDVPGDKLGLKTSDVLDVLNIKVRQEYVGSLREREGIFPAYHMNKAHWVSVLLDGPVSESEIIDLLNDSFLLTS